jgi:hypothetical protein
MYAAMTLRQVLPHSWQEMIKAVTVFVFSLPGVVRGPYFFDLFFFVTN